MCGESRDQSTLLAKRTAVLSLAQLKLVLLVHELDIAAIVLSVNCYLLYIVRAAVCCVVEVATSEAV